MLRAYRCMHAAPHLQLDLVQLPSHALSLGPPLDHQAPVPTPRAVVREAEKRKRHESLCVAPPSAFGHEFSKLEKAPLVPMER
jgi:hypothetical protein